MYWRPYRSFDDAPTLQITMLSDKVKVELNGRHMAASCLYLDGGRHWYVRERAPLLFSTAAHSAMRPPLSPSTPEPIVDRIVCKCCPTGGSGTTSSRSTIAIRASNIPQDGSSLGFRASSTSKLRIPFVLSVMLKQFRACVTALPMVAWPTEPRWPITSRVHAIPWHPFQVSLTCLQGDLSLCMGP